MSGGLCLYCVVIRDNLVTGIEAVAPRDDIVVPDSPLAVSSLLAGNYRRNGRLDGHYYFNDCEAARHFSSLSLDFLKRVVERSTEALNNAPIQGSGWVNPHLCSSGGE